MRFGGPDIGPGYPVTRARAGSLRVCADGAEDGDPARAPEPPARRSAWRARAECLPAAAQVACSQHASRPALGRAPGCGAYGRTRRRVQLRKGARERGGGAHPHRTRLQRRLPAAHSIAIGRTSPPVGTHASPLAGVRLDILALARLRRGRVQWVVVVWPPGLGLTGHCPACALANHVRPGSGRRRRVGEHEPLRRAQKRWLCALIIGQALPHHPSGERLETVPIVLLHCPRRSRRPLSALASGTYGRTAKV
ncbi:hypothetical protein BD413DRAFT_136821 [Trametes elegans]|nr:hypothetical protein BD413DRAFT_136821 [Trametes elegans]